MSLKIDELQLVLCHFRVEVEGNFNFASVDWKAFELKVEVQPDYVLQETRIRIEGDECSHRLHHRLSLGQFNQSHSALYTCTCLLEIL